MPINHEPGMTSLNSDTATRSTRQEKEVLSVSELNQRARNLLEGEFPRIWVEGEISNFSAPASGHWYFTLKDGDAQVQCAMFRGRNRMLRFRPENGMQVILRGRVSLYEARGNYQLLADNLTQAGEGQLQRRFEELKNRLAAEGLFAEDRKQPLPEHPRQLGVITSASGAAVRDIITVLNRRFPAIPVTLLPVAVQGYEATGEIVAAIEQANSDTAPDFDVLIVGRGGGSLEDLWPFNEEKVARAIHASRIPIVSAVGHEVDFTIADFVADTRAATPSAAAELLSPDQIEWAQNLGSYRTYFTDQAKRLTATFSERVNHLAKRLKHPGRQLQEYAQRLDELEARITMASKTQISLKQAELKATIASLQQNHPGHQVDAMKLHSINLRQRLHVATQQRIKDYRHRFQMVTQNLNTLSPLETLQRGYAIVQDTEGQIVRNASTLKIGDRVRNQLAEGSINCEVVGVE